MIFIVFLIFFKEIFKIKKETRNKYRIYIYEGARKEKCNIKNKTHLRLIDDKVFKAVFCKPGNEHLLKELTERILDIYLENIKILSPE